MERRALEEYDVETLELIEERNFENWIHSNKELVGVLYNEPKGSNQLSTDKRFRESKLFKILKRGVEFGALIRISKWSVCHLTDKAKMYYEVHLKDDIT